MKNIKEKIKELKKTERGRAILKLSGYMIFFIFVLILIALSNNMSNTPNNYNEMENSGSNESSETDIPVNNEIKILTYLEKQEKFYNSNYKYTYKITGETNILFTGNYIDGIYEGYKETSQNTIKYRIEDNKIYEIKLNEKKEITDIYHGLDSNLFNLKYIFNKLNKSETIIERKDTYKTYTYENVDGYKYTVYLNDLEITKIQINNQNLNYEFTFEY